MGGLAFIMPGLMAIVALAALFLGAPPDWVLGVGAGAGAVIAAVAVQAGASLLPAGWARTAGRERVRFAVYVVVGAAATVLIGPWLVLVLLACGFVEMTWRRAGPRGARAGVHAWPLALLLATAGSAALARSRGRRSRSGPCPTAVAS